MPFGKPKRPRIPLDEAQLLDYAAKSLGARMQSERDLRRKLLDRAEPGPAGAAAADAVLAKLRELRYLSDERFAADFTKLRQENRAFGRRRVQQDLQVKGIAPDLIATTLATAYDGLDEAALVREHIARRRLAAPTDDKSTARLLRRLTAAGFGSKAIFKVLRELRTGETGTAGETADTLDRAEAAAAED